MGRKNFFRHLQRQKYKVLGKFLWKLLEKLTASWLIVSSRMFWLLIWRRFSSLFAALRSQMRKIKTKRELKINNYQGLSNSNLLTAWSKTESCLRCVWCWKDSVLKLKTPLCSMWSNKISPKTWRTRQLNCCCRLAKKFVRWQEGRKWLVCCTGLGSASTQDKLGNSETWNSHETALKLMAFDQWRKRQYDGIRTKHFRIKK